MWVHLFIYYNLINKYKFIIYIYIYICLCQLGSFCFLVHYKEMCAVLVLRHNFVDFALHTRFVMAHFALPAES